MKTELRHTLVQYQGGGYDGCIWEWNYFYIDHDREFHNIQSSGYAGCTTTEQAEALLAENSEHTYTYDVTDPAAIAEFSRESAAPHILGVLQWMNDNDIPFYTACTECARVIEWAEDLILENWHGCGGIASTADTLLCTDCHSGRVCECCNEYVGADDLDQLDPRYENGDDRTYQDKAAERLLDDGYDAVCSCCLEGEANNIELEERADMLSAFLATGMPDLFSDEMRWFWV